jgi:hypothetical protein
MIKKTFLFSLLVCALLTANSCKKDTIQLPDEFYREYFNDAVGSYIIYECDSIIYDDFNQSIDTNSFLIKEYFQSTFVDNSGRNAIRVERWKKPADSLNWFLKDVWSLVKTDVQVEKVEEDVRFIKLVFPVRANLQWNTNSLNSLDARTVAYSKVHEAFSTDSLQFDSTITVENIDPANLVSEYRNTEVFAKNAGMIYKKFVDVKYIIPTNEIKSGLVFTMKAIEIGTE